MKKNYRPRKAERLITKEEDESYLIFDPDTGAIKVLNETAALIWNNIGEKTVEDLVEIVAGENPDEKRDVIEKDVHKFLKELEELNFIEE